MHPYQVRHGAASHDALYKVRVLKQIQTRLRHMTETSTRRYEKHTRYLAVINRLPQVVKEYGKFVNDHLPELLTGKQKAPKPPGAGHRLNH